MAKCFVWREEVKGKVGETEAFVEKQTTLFYGHEHENYLQDLGLKSLWLLNVVEQETRFW